MRPNGYPTGFKIASLSLADAPHHISLGFFLQFFLIFWYAFFIFFLTSSRHILSSCALSLHFRYFVILFTFFSAIRIFLLGILF